MIALSHKTRFGHTVYCVNEADAPTLFDRAQAGDTLHCVADTIGDDVPALMSQIDSQLQQGKFTRI